MELKTFIKFSTNYVIPILAITISIFSYIDSKKVLKVQTRLNEMEEKLKRYELDEKEKEHQEATVAKVEARIYKISKGNYVMKIWNAGKANAYNVDFSIPDDLKGLIFRDKVPFEILEHGKSFEEHVVVCGGMPTKFKVKTNWTDIKGKEFHKDQIVTI